MAHRDPTAQNVKHLPKDLKSRNSSNGLDFFQNFSGFEFKSHTDNPIYCKELVAMIIETWNEDSNMNVQE